MTPKDPDWGYAEKELDVALWNAYRELVLRGGVPRPRQSQVAATMGVSVATVRRRLRVVGVTRYAQIHKLMSQLP